MLLVGALPLTVLPFTPPSGPSGSLPRQPMAAGPGLCRHANGLLLCAQLGRSRAAPRRSPFPDQPLPGSPGSSSARQPMAAGPGLCRQAGVPPSGPSPFSRQLGMLPLGPASPFCRQVDVLPLGTESSPGRHGGVLSAPPCRHAGVRPFAALPSCGPSPLTGAAPLPPGRPSPAESAPDRPRRQLGTSASAGSAAGAPCAQPFTAGLLLCAQLGRSGRSSPSVQRRRSPAVAGAAPAGQ